MGIKPEVAVDHQPNVEQDIRVTPQVKTLPPPLELKPMVKPLMPYSPPLEKKPEEKTQKVGGPPNKMGIKPEVAIDPPQPNVEQDIRVTPQVKTLPPLPELKPMVKPLMPYSPPLEKKPEE